MFNNHSGAFFAKKDLIDVPSKNDFGAHTSRAWVLHRFFFFSPSWCPYPAAPGAESAQEPAPCTPFG